MRRAIIIVLDSVGIGELPDSAEYGDEGSNTLVNLKRAVPEMNLKNLNALGLSNIDGADTLSDFPIGKPTGAFCKLAEKSKGKDTTVGHWEIAGLWTETPMPTYPNGFPAEIIDEFERRTGRKTLGNCTASGTEIIERLGKEHVETGGLIVYTSADSVFQIAAHESVVPIEEQYRISEIAREMLNPYNVSRVITRPFTGQTGAFKRTANRRDYSLTPPGDTILDLLKRAGKEVAAVGKIEDIFCNRGITRSVHTTNNGDGITKTAEFLATAGEGLIFTNLVDTDMIYGHRNDTAGYANALAEFDRRLPEITGGLRGGDLLFITADHGCDPTTPSTDHSREYIPLIMTGNMVKKGVNLGVRETFSDIGATALDWLGVENTIRGNSLLKQILIKER